MLRGLFGVQTTALMHNLTAINRIYAMTVMNGGKMVSDRYSCPILALRLLKAQPTRVKILQQRSQYFLQQAKANGWNTATSQNSAIILNQQILAIFADVSQREQVESAIASPIIKLGVPDLLITSAAIAHPGYFADELPVAIFEQTMAIA